LADWRMRMAWAAVISSFDEAFAGNGTRVIKTPVRSPRANSMMERWIGNCRRELLDRTLVWNQRHLMTVLREYEDFYNTRRPTAPSARPRRSARCPTASPT